MVRTARSTAQYSEATVENPSPDMIMRLNFISGRMRQQIMLRSIVWFPVGGALGMLLYWMLVYGDTPAWLAAFFAGLMGYVLGQIVLLMAASL